MISILKVILDTAIEWGKTTVFVVALMLVLTGFFYLLLHYTLATFLACLVLAFVADVFQKLVERDDARIREERIKKILEGTE